ncbi:16S rRNA (uracil(1498)-N(3))-methyltransferase [Jatrophihabitans sp. DSM 45814]
MTLALYLVPELDPQLGPGDVVELEGAEARHAASAKRLVIGEHVLLADGQGAIVEVVAVSVQPERIRFEIRTRGFDPEPDPRFVVVQALPKGDRADLAVESLTELGVDEIVPWSASRSISVWRDADKIDKGVTKWRRTAREAAKQSRRARIPTVAGLASTPDIAALIAASDAAFVLHESATRSLAQCPLPKTGAIVLVVGPEGGVSEQELQAFGDAGAAVVRLGDTVLRTSTAGAAGLAVLSVSTGRWNQPANVAT